MLPNIVKHFVHEKGVGVLRGQGGKVVEVNSGLLLGLLLDHSVYIKGYQSYHCRLLGCLINKQMRIISRH